MTVTPLEDDAAISGSHDVIKTTDDNNNNTTTKPEGSTATFSDSADMSSLKEDQEGSWEGRVFGDRVIRGKVQSANAKDRSGSSVNSSIRDRKISKDPVRDDGSADGIVFRETSTPFATVVNKDSDLKNKDDQTKGYAAIKNEGLQNVATGFVFDSDEMLNTFIHLDHQKQPQQSQEDKELEQEVQQKHQQQQQEQKKEQQQRGHKQPRGRRPTALNGRFVRGGPADSSFPGNSSSERNINVDNRVAEKQQHLIFNECNNLNGEGENSECNGIGSRDNSNSNIDNSSKDISNISSNTTTDPTGTGLIGKTKKRPRNPGNP